MIEDARMLGVAAQLEREESAAQDVVNYFACHECRSCVTASGSIHELQKLWTDGAAANNQDHRFRRAGFGIYYDDGHDMNMSALVPGLRQTNQRAELLAVVVACLRDPRPLDIRSDSDYVCKVFHEWRSWAHVGWSGDHADLWDLLATELHARTAEVQVTWVKGHATCVDVQRGRTTEEDKKGNEGADALAVAGARLHHIDSEVLAAAKDRRSCAKQVQQMMVTVLQARFEADGNRNDAGEMDRGSDCDDCMDEGFDACDDVACVASVAAPDTEDHVVHASDNADCTELNVQEFNSMMFLTGGPAS